MNKPKTEFLDNSGNDDINVLRRKRERNYETMKLLDTQIAETSSQLEELQHAKLMLRGKQAILSACIKACENSIPQSPRCYYCSKPLNGTKPLAMCVPCNHVYCTECIEQQMALHSYYEQTEELFGDDPFSCPKCDVEVIDTIQLYL